MCRTIGCWYLKRPSPPSPPPSPPIPALALHLTCMFSVFQVLISVVAGYLIAHFHVETELVQFLSDLPATQHKVWAGLHHHHHHPPLPQPPKSEEVTVEALMALKDMDPPSVTQLKLGNCWCEMSFPFARSHSPLLLLDLMNNGSGLSWILLEEPLSHMQETLCFQILLRKEWIVDSG